MEDKVVAFLRSRGPSLPSDISKNLKTDTFFAGAHLSTLVESNKAFVSHLKIGSSPLYYLKEHRSRLEHFAKYLGEKDKKAFDLLKEKKVLRDKSLDALTRVSLRSIKDFAVQLNVTVASNREVFWKFYSVNDEEVNLLIKNILELGSVNQVKKKESDFPVGDKEIKESQKIAPEKEKVAADLPVPEKAVDDIKVKEDMLSSIRDEIKREVLAQMEIEHDKKAKDVLKDKAVRKEQKKVVESPKESQEKLVDVKEKPLLSGEFYDSVISHFKSKSIKVESAGMVKKDKEYDFVVKIPSAAGELAYFCRAKSKKRVNEGDLSSVVLKAQSRRLPAVFLSDGDLTKKAEKVLNDELKDQITVMKL